MTTIQQDKDVPPPETEKVYTDAQLMENRRKLILSIWAHNSRSFVRKDKIIPRKKNLKAVDSHGERSDRSSFRNSTNSLDSSTWSVCTALENSCVKQNGM